MAIRDLTERHFKNPFGMIAGRDLVNNENDTLQSSVSYAFLSGIVSDVISNPYEFLRRKYGDTDFLLKDVLSGRVPVGDESPKNTSPTANFLNHQMIETMPANSIFAYLIDDNQSKDNPKLAVCYPFFPSHIALPMKPGEYVWIICENIKGTKYYYWMCRKPSTRQIEDVNYSNYERLTGINEVIDSQFSSGGTASSDYEEAFSLDEKKDLSQEGYVSNSSNFPISMENIIKNSYAYSREFTGEPVPRIAKDCGDLLIQGSNNAGIHLTTEKFTDEFNIDKSRFYAGSGNERNEPPPQRKPLSAAVDIFVTRKKSSIEDIVDTSPEASLSDSNSKIKAQTNNCSNDYFNFVENNKIADIMSNDMNIYDAELNDNQSDATDVGARLYMSHICDVDNVFGSNFDVLSAHLGPSIVTYAQHNRVIGAADVRLTSRVGQSFIDMDTSGNIVAKASIDDGQQFLSLGASGTTRLQAKDRIEISQSGNNTDEPEIVISNNNVTVDSKLITMVGSENITLTAGEPNTNPKVTTIFATQEGGVQVINAAGEGDAAGVLGLAPLVKLVNDAGIYSSAFGADALKLGVAAPAKPLFDMPNPVNPPRGALPSKFQETLIFYILSQMSTKYFFAE